MKHQSRFKNKYIVNFLCLLRFPATGPAPFSAAAEFQDSGIAESDESHHSTETGHHQQVKRSKHCTITANTLQIHSS